MSTSVETLITVKKPSLFWLATETGRALFEWSTNIPFRFLDRHKKGSGDGHPVLLLPGFMACLLYTSPSPRDRTRSRMPSSA